MKKLILTFGIVLAGIFIVNAQDKAVAKATKMVDQVNQVCGLSQDQASKLQVAAEDCVRTREANKRQYGGNLDALKNANKTANHNYKTQMKSILTPEQAEKLKAYKAQQKGNGQGVQEENEEKTEQGGGQQ